MRICRFDDNRVGIVSDEGIRDVTEVLDGLPQVTYPLPRHDPFIAALHDLAPELLAAARRASPIPVDQVKAPSSLVGPGEGVKLVHLDRRNDHEVELAVVIARKARNVSAAEAPGCIAGYCIGLDMTIRGPEERSLRKSPDSYCVLGPWLTTPDEIPDPGH